MKTNLISILLSILLFFSCSKRGGDEEFLIDVHEDILFTQDKLNRNSQSMIDEFKKIYDRTPDFMGIYFNSMLDIDSICNSHIAIINNIKKERLGDFKKTKEFPTKRNLVNSFINDEGAIKSIEGSVGKISKEIVPIISKFPGADIEYLKKNVSLLSDSNGYSNDQIIQDISELNNLQLLMYISLLEEKIIDTKHLLIRKISSGVSGGVTFDKRTAVCDLEAEVIKYGDTIKGQVFLGEFDLTPKRSRCVVDNNEIFSDDDLYELKYYPVAKGVNKHRGLMKIKLDDGSDSYMPFNFEYFVK
jgi:hypothetical protein